MNDKTFRPSNIEISRRSLLSRAASITGGGAMLGGISALITSCEQDQNRGGPTSADGRTVRIGMWDAYAAPIEPFLKEFEEENGIRVEVVPSRGATGLDLIQEYSPEFSSSRTSVDILNCSDEAAPGFARAGWLEPLDDIATDSFWDDYPEPVRDYTRIWGSYEGSTYRIPIQYDVRNFFVRKDVLDSIGQEPPTTWDEMIRLVPAAQAADFFVFCSPLQVPGNAFSTAAYLSLQAGGIIYEFDEGTRAAFEFTKELLESGAQPSESIGWGFSPVYAAYLNNEVLCMSAWSSFRDTAQEENPDWWAPEKTTTVLPPAGSGNGGQQASYDSGWGLVVPAASEAKDEAKALIKWLVAPERSVELAEASAFWSVPRHSNLSKLPDKPEFKAISSYIEAGVVKPKPFHPNIQASEIVERVFTSYLTDQMSLDEAIELGHEQVDALG